MDIQTQASAVPVSAAKGIDVARIEKELAVMWRPATGVEGSNAESGVTRACALNLLVYAAAEDDRAQIDEMLDAVNQQHPGRTLVLFADREAAEPKLDAYVSTRCRMLGGSRKQVCGEQVTIEASGAAVTTVASAIAPLLVPDVPVFLWWKDIPHYDDVLFNRMAAMADRIVIDSSCFDQPHSDMQRLARIVGERPQYMSATDLNWGRLTAWRTLIAGFWDVPDYRPYLERIERVTVEYDAPDAAPGEIAPKALLVVGWLASRLGWKLEGAGAHEEGITAGFIFGAGEHRIDVRMSVSEGRASSDGMLDGVTFSSAGPHAEFRVALSADGKRLETDAGIDGVRSVGRVLSYEQKSEGQRLSRELTLPVRDIVYEQALREAARLIEAMK